MRVVRAFTLIELLVVLTILGVALTFVGPLTFQQFENVQRDKEIQQVIAYIDKARYKALNARQSLSVELSGKRVSSSNQLIEQTLTTEYISFPSQVVVFNENGFSNTDEVMFQYRDSNRVIQLPLPVY